MKQKQLQEQHLQVAHKLQQVEVSHWLPFLHNLPTSQASPTSTLKTGAAASSEMLVITYQTTWCHITGVCNSGVNWSFQKWLLFLRDMIITYDFCLKQFFDVMNN
jgi:hypothetical protein